MNSFRYIIPKLETAIKPILEKETAPRFVVYPYGEIGRGVRHYLIKKNMRVEYTIDNIGYNGQDVLSLSQAKMRDNTGIYFLISSDAPQYYEEIRQNIYQTFDATQIIDIFPCEKTELPSDNCIKDVLVGLETHMRTLENEIC